MCWQEGPPSLPHLSFLTPAGMPCIAACHKLAVAWHSCKLHSSSPVNFVHVTELAWDVWVYAEHMSKGDGRDNLFFEPDHVCSPTLALIIPVVRCTAKICHRNSWAVKICIVDLAAPTEAAPARSIVFEI